MPEIAPPAHPAALRLGVIVSALLALAGGAAFWGATSLRGAEALPGNDATITITARGCAPNALSLPAGSRRFAIVNRSDRPIEWEILNGVMVVAERENITPGITQVVEARLAPGSYQMTCGLLSNPTGTLEVGAAPVGSAAATVELRNFIGPLSEYRVYTVLQSRKAVNAVRALRDALEAGDLAAARKAWLAARLPYRTIEPLAWRMADLDTKIDPIATYLALHEADPDFTGFHRIEYGLFAQATTAGLVPVAERLLADMQALSDRLGKEQVPPALLMALPGDLARQLAESRILPGEDLYSGADLPELAATLEGIDKLTGLLQAIAAPVAPALAAEITRRSEAIAARLAGFRQGADFPAYDRLAGADRQALADDFAALARTLDQLPDVIGVN